MRKLFTLFFALVASVGTIFAVSGTCGDNLTWNLTNGVLTISGTGDMYNWSYASQVPWDSQRSNITAVSIGNSVTSIGNWAFEGCTGLTSVTIPNSVTSIGSYAFAFCSGLTSVTIPNSVTSIGDQAFAECTGLTSITCEATTPPTLEYEVFYSVDKSIPLYVPAESIDLYKAADGWSEFTNIQPIEGTCTEEPTTIPQGALPGVFSVGENKTVHFSQGNLQYVGTWQFAENQWDCFGNSQYDDHRDLFGWGTGDNPNEISKDNDNYATFTDWGINAISNGGNKANLWRTLTKDEFVYLFYTRENATTLFGLGKVNGVNGTILLPDNWTLPEGASFTASTTQGLADEGEYYYNPNGANFSHNTYTAEQWAIMDSAGAVFLPAAGWQINATVYCVNLNGTYWSATPYDESRANYLDFDWYNFMPQAKKDRYHGSSVRLVSDYKPCLIASGTCGKNLTWELSCDSVLTISGKGKMTWENGYWYSHTDEIKHVIISEGVTTIGDSAFTYCQNLQTIEVPNTVTYIGQGAFAHCSSLTSVTIPNSVTSIGNNAFYYCTGLTSVTIPNSVTSIGYEAFRGCSGLPIIDNIRYADTYMVEAIDKSLSSYTIKEETRWIGSSAFDQCTNLTSISLPDSLLGVGSYAFSGCKNLNTLIMPNSVTSIGGGAFLDCTGLTSVTIGNSVTSIGDWAFYLCTGLTSITCEAITPPTLGSNVFLSVDKSIPLYVPAESVEAYQTADQWKDFTNIIGLDDGDVEESNIRYIDPSNNELGSETVSLHLPDVPEIEGFTFLKWQVVAGDLEEGIIIQAVYQADESTSASSVYTNPANPAQKLIRNGNVYILSNEKTYSITGQEVK